MENGLRFFLIAALIGVALFGLVFEYLVQDRSFSLKEVDTKARLQDERCFNSGGDKLILISVDGLQLSHFNEMLDDGLLENFKLLLEDGFNGQIEITHHSKTVTAPGHAEMLTGYGSEVNGVFDNYWGVIVDDLSIFEKLNSIRGDVVLGSIWGKDNSYVPGNLLMNAKTEIDWWQDFSTWNEERWEGNSGVATAESVSSKASEFVDEFAEESFFLFVHFGDVDAAGHKYGENSADYDGAVFDVDEGIGTLMNTLKENDIDEEVVVIITTDHGFAEGGKGHSGGSDPNNGIIPLVSNNNLIVKSETSNGVREQCEITPTILDYFGVDIRDLENYGCDSMSSMVWEECHNERPKYFSLLFVLSNITTDNLGNY